MNAKNANMGPPPKTLSMYTKLPAISAAKIQCVLLPRELPKDLTEFGNISEINTQITAPWPIAWEAINTNVKIGMTDPDKFSEKNA